MRIAVLIALAAALLFAAPAGAVVRFAAPTPTGSTTNPTCNPTPCELRRAISTVGQAGDTVILAPGTYDPSTWQSTLLTQTKPGMTVRGAGGAPRPKVTAGSGADNVFTAAAGTRFIHLQVQSDSGYGAPIQVNSPNVLQEDLILIAGGHHGTAAQVDDGSVLRDSVAYAPGTDGRGVFFGGNGNMTATVRNVTALASGSNGEALSGHTNSSGACDTTRPTVLDVKNVIALGGGKDVVLRPDTTCPLRFPITLKAAVSNYRSIASGPQGALITGSSIQAALPAFSTEGGAPAYHQAPGSPTIDAGVADGQLGLLDPDGEPRVQGLAVDIGADETAKAPPPPPPAAPAPTPTPDPPATPAADPPAPSSGPQAGAATTAAGAGDSASPAGAAPSPAATSGAAASCRLTRATLRRRVVTATARCSAAVTATLRVPGVARKRVRVPARRATKISLRVSRRAASRVTARTRFTLAGPTGAPLAGGRLKRLR